MDDKRITIACQECGQVLQWSGNGDVTVEPCANCVGALRGELEQQTELTIEVGQGANEIAAERDELRDHVESLKELVRMRIESTSDSEVNELRAEVERTRSRCQTIADEAFGPFVEQGIDLNLTAVESGIARQHRSNERLRAEVERLKPQHLLTCNARDGSPIGGDCCSCRIVSSGDVERAESAERRLQAVREWADNLTTEAFIGPRHKAGYARAQEAVLAILDADQPPARDEQTGWRQQALDDPGDERPQQKGWAPGGYICECAKCGRGFTGAKRATWCADCAYADPPPAQGCTWTVDDDGAWQTECGESFEFASDGPEANSARYCQYCGKRIEIEEPPA